jgi:hypothetical protein
MPPLPSPQFRKPPELFAPVGSRMPRLLSELFKEIASQASDFDEPILAQLCRMAALESAHTKILLDWDWDTINSSGLSLITTEKPLSQILPAPNVRQAKPYLVRTRKGTGLYSVITADAKSALAKVVELSAAGHSDVVIRDMDGNEIELEVLKFVVEMEANPTLQLVPK